MSVPLHIVTGFLGAGKSTVLSHLLAQATGERIAVLVNEVGELAIDHHLLETLDDEVLLLDSGCVCCTIQGELFAAIERALTLEPSRIVVETSGIADPAPIVNGLASHPRLSKAVSLCGVVAVVDAERGEILLDEPEAAAQVELADRIVVSKSDLAPGRIPALRARLEGHAPGADICHAVNGEVDVGWLLASVPTKRFGEAAGARAWLAHPPAREHDLVTRVVALEGQVDEEALGLWLRLVTQLDGDRLLRIKGIVEGRRSGALVLLQSVQHSVFPSRVLATRPRGWQGSALVIIARGAGEDLVTRWVELAKTAARGDPWTG